MVKGLVLLEIGNSLTKAVELSIADVPPELIVIIPCYGYASLMPELLTGLLVQTGSVAFRCVIVDDGDPDPQMRDTAGCYAAAYPSFIHYLRPCFNGGLPAARNAGVEYAMKQWPSLRIVVFPDADDRVDTDYVSNSLAGFDEANRKAVAEGCRLGWVFEDPKMFGVMGAMSRVTEYSMLWNLVGATQMPSSALSMEMFKEGLRYDETLQWSGEDWAFSIAALRHGFVGRYCERQGFVWRRRPGSLSARNGAHSPAGEHNRTHIRLANPDIFQYSELLGALATENDHYCIVSKQDVYLASQPIEIAQIFHGQKEPLPIDDLSSILHHNLEYNADRRPETYVIAPSEMPRSLVDGPDFSFFLQISDFYASRKICVCHRFNFNAGRHGTAKLITVDLQTVQSPCDVVILPHDKILSAMNSESPESQFLICEWAIPENEANEIPSKDAFEDLDVLIDRIIGSGYGTRRAKRFSRITWRPHNLSWRTIPGFFFGNASIFPDDDRSGRRLVVCRAGALEAVLDESTGSLRRGFDVMTVTPTTGADDQLIAQAAQAGRIDRHYPASSALTSAGPSKNFWREEPMIRAMLGYHTITFWRTMDFSDKLALLKATGVYREIVFDSPADATQVLDSVSSAFKCYDVYRILNDGEGKAASTLSALGVPKESVKTGYPAGEPCRSN